MKNSGRLSQCRSDYLWPIAHCIPLKSGTCSTLDLCSISVKNIYKTDYQSSSLCATGLDNIASVLYAEYTLLLLTTNLKKNSLSHPSSRSECLFICPFQMIKCSEYPKSSIVSTHTNKNCGLFCRNRFPNHWTHGTHECLRWSSVLITLKKMFSTLASENSLLSWKHIDMTNIRLSELHSDTQLTKCQLFRSGSHPFTDG